MISTGIRAQVGVKILGDDLDALQAKAFEVEKVIRQIPGAVGVAPTPTAPSEQVTTCPEAEQVP